MTDDDLPKHVNRSVFPLQIGIEHAISTAREHGWQVLSREHAWQTKSEDGFIDLVIGTTDKHFAGIIECKRVRDTAWIFLCDEEQPKQRAHAKVWLSSFKNSQECIAHSWIDMNFEPKSYESEFCIVVGQDSKSRPMLERISADVISSTEAFALEEHNLLYREKTYIRMYLSIIVTTASLKLCTFDPAKIVLSTGDIDNPNFIDVPYIRFRKQLSTKFSNGIPKIFENHREICQAKEHTIFVVNAENFIDFIKGIEINDYSYQNYLPY